MTKITIDNVRNHLDSGKSVTAKHPRITSELVITKVYGKYDIGYSYSYANGACPFSDLTDVKLK